MRLQEKPPALPPDPRQQRAHGIRHDIERIARRPSQPMRPNPLEQHRPDREVPENLAARRPAFPQSQAQPTLRQQHRRQRARDEQPVIEPAPEQRQMRVRFDAPAVQRIQDTTSHAQRVEHVTEGLHSKAIMITPAPSASNSFKESVNMTGCITFRPEPRKQTLRLFTCERVKVRPVLVLQINKARFRDGAWVGGRSRPPSTVASGRPPRLLSPHIPRQ